MEESVHGAEVLDRFVEGAFHLMLEHHHRQVVEMDLTLTQTQALRLLRSNALPTGEIAIALGISAPAVTQLTDRLVRKHLIERLSHEADRRRVSVALTKRGQMVIDELRQGRSRVFGEALSRLGETDRNHVLEAFAKITAVIEVREQVVLGVDAAVGPPRDRVTRRTPERPAEASNNAGQVPVTRPAKRMRIEWD